MKRVKPSVDILEGLSTGVNMDVSAPHLIDKWLNESRYGDQHHPILSEDPVVAAFDRQNLLEI
jgi:hypothetical protein